MNIIIWRINKENKFGKILCNTRFVSYNLYRWFYCVEIETIIMVKRLKILSGQREYRLMVIILYTIIVIDCY